MHLIGLDIGFSERRRTNALAQLHEGKLTVEKLNVAERNERLRALSGIDMIAIDAPIVPSSSSPDVPRAVERTMSRGLFQKRCKPGHSHVRGTGRTLREHGNSAAELVRRAAPSDGRRIARVVPDANVVEAFPNAFLGVLVSNAAYESAPTFKRGGKFDWLYDQNLRTAAVRELAESAALPSDFIRVFIEERDHEKRAALVCLLTAALAAAELAHFVGDEHTGYFALPPIHAWQTWATSALDRAHS